MVGTAVELDVRQVCGVVFFGCGNFLLSSKLNSHMKRICLLVN